jgi:acyl-ACP thioesterase
MPRLGIPEGAYEVATHVRSYEVGRTGTIRLGTILRYFENLATLHSAQRGFDHNWYEHEGSAWVVREMRLLLGPPPGIAEELRMATWLSGFRRVQAHREYALWRAADGRLLARAQARWAYVDRIAGQPRRLPESLIERFNPLGGAIPTHHHPMSASPESEARSELALTARDYEADSNQHINNCVYADWLDEALARAPLEAARILPRHVALEYLRPALPGESLRIATRTTRSGSRGLAAIQEITREPDVAVVLRASSEHLLLAR